jgi:hypothetical protein
MDKKYLLLVTILVFPFLWLIILKVISYLSGWNSLTSKYPFIDDMQVRKYYFQSIKFGSAKYNSCITVGVNEEYLSLGMFFLFKFGHSSITIPIRDITGKETEGFFNNYVDLSFINAPGISVSISNNLADKIESASGYKWKYMRLQKSSG